MTALNLSPSEILECRTGMAMTQLEFGNFLGVEENTVWRWEAGIHAPVGKKKKVIRDNLTRVRRNNNRLRKGAASDERTDNRD